MINVVDWSVVQGFSADDATANKAKCWLLLAMVLAFGSVFGAVAVLAVGFDKTDDKYGGVAVLLQNFFILIRYAAQPLPHRLVLDCSALDKTRMKSPFKLDHASKRTSALIHSSAAVHAIEMPLHRLRHAAARVFGRRTRQEEEEEGPYALPSPDQVPSPRVKDLDTEHKRGLQFIGRLDSKVMDPTELHAMCWSGIPSRARHQYWLLLLDVLPLEKNRRSSLLHSRRAKYKTWAKEYFDETVMSAAMKETLLQIRKDVPRTCPEIDVFQNQKVQLSLERTLYIWSIRNPAAGYVQGINDLATPFFYVFLSNQVIETETRIQDWDEEQRLAVEADVFWCLSKILGKIQENYIFAQPGIQRMVYRLEDLIRRMDMQLYRHLESHSILFIQFAFRWMNCFLIRELPLHLVVRLFDTYLVESRESSNGFASFHVYVCAALLLYFAPKLKQLDFQDLIFFLQHLPTSKWNEEHIAMLLSQAFVYESLFEDSPSHFK